MKKLTRKQIIQKMSKLIDEHNELIREKKPSEIIEEKVDAFYENEIYQPSRESIYIKAIIEYLDEQWRKI